MTLIIGIKCKDGAVLGADGAATLTDASLQPTIQLPVRKKLQILSGQVVVGVSGNVGLGQNIGQAIGEAWSKKEFASKSNHQAGQILRNKIWDQLRNEVAIAHEAAKAFGQASINNIVTGSAVGIVISDKACLFQFDHQGMPCEMTEDLPLLAIGSGQRIADPFLTFLRRVFWPTGLPSIAEATLATIWTLQHVIDTNPGGVGGQMQAVILQRDAKKNWSAKELEEKEWDEHRQDINDAERVLKEFRKYLSASTTPPPMPPTSSITGT